MLKKVLKRIGIVFSIFFGVVLLFFVGLTATHMICCNIEQKEILDAYGQSVEVFSKNIRVDIIGNGDDVIVLLPGAGEPSPVLNYKPLAELLSENYTVVTVEYFGYGLSDLTDRERTVENISEELHAVLSKLGYSEYILMPHSLSGITTLYYANQYPEEVKALAGIDTSVSAQLDYFDFSSENIKQGNFYVFLNNTGILRLITKISPDFLSTVIEVNDYEYSSEDYALYRQLYLNKLFNRNIVEEIKLMNTNADIVSDMAIPDTIPVMFFLSEVSSTMFVDSFNAPDNTWYDMHENIIGNKNVSKIIMLDAGHNLQRSNWKDIAKQFDEWYQGLK